MLAPPCGAGKSQHGIPVGYACRSYSKKDADVPLADVQYVQIPHTVVVRVIHQLPTAASAFILTELFYFSLQYWVGLVHPNVYGRYGLESV